MKSIAPITVNSTDLQWIAKSEFQSQVLPLFRQACFDCHSTESNEGELDLESLMTERPLVKNRLKWINVYEQTRNHVMPPEDADALGESKRRKMVAWIHNEIHNFDYSTVSNPGFESTRRLTHREYSNTVGDLFGEELNVISKFPADMSATSGFDNSANSLFIQPLLMEKYIQISEFIAEQIAENQRQTPAVSKPFFESTPTESLPATLAFQKNLALFLPKAFRRPVSAKELAAYQKIFDEAHHKTSDFITASQLALQAILISPNFLFHIESKPEDQTEFLINDWELANRMSYFLWSSMPDKELRQLAKQGKLKSETVVKTQVNRMLDDPRSIAIGDVFASQWLGFQHLGTRIRADPIDNPWCTDSLMDAMKKETSMFIHSLVMKNRPLKELLQADYTFANEELAKYYGMRDVAGKQMRRVKASSKRGGILGQASILAVTSYPYQTSPVKRGTWVLTDLIGTPPPPPPPGASVFDERIEENERLSFRQKLQRHSTNASCASCHNQIDPLGFGLENFDWFGRYRSRGIDSSGKLPDGTKFRGLAGLKKVLVAKKMDDIARNFIRKLLGFSLSRQLEYYDEKTVLEIFSRTKRNGFPARDIVLEVVQSYPFQFKRVQD